MSVRNAGKTIREARIKAGLTQEQLSEGVCSVLSLSRIENGSAGVSPVTFQALMAHAGAPCEVYPIFASRTDFDCFYTLNRARFYLSTDTPIAVASNTGTSIFILARHRIPFPIY